MLVYDSATDPAALCGKMNESFAPFNARIERVELLKAEI